MTSRQQQVLRRSIATAPEEGQRRDEFIMRLQENGEIDQLKQQLMAKLAECGWLDDMRDKAQDVVRDRGGVTQITVDELVAELVSQGKDSVPSHVKSDMSTQLKDLLGKGPHTQTANGRSSIN